MKFKIILFLVLFSAFCLLTSDFVSAQGTLPTYSLPPLPTGTGLTETGVQGLLIKFANFLIWVGVVIAVIVIVWSGIMYFRAGSDTEAKSAKGWFRNGIIGAVIILAVGVIILTIYNLVVTGSFFGGPSIPGVPGVPAPGQPAPGAPGQPAPGGSGTKNIGDRCIDPSECKQELTCNQTTGECKRINGNLQGETCEGNSDCLAGLVCGRSAGSLFLRKECKSGGEQKVSCQLSRILTDKNSVTINDVIRVTVVATDATSCTGKSINLQICQNQNCNPVTPGTFGTSTFTQLFSVSNLNFPNPSVNNFYFRAIINSSAVQSGNIIIRR